MPDSSQYISEDDRIEFITVLIGAFSITGTALSFQGRMQDEFEEDRVAMATALSDICREQGRSTDGMADLHTIIELITTFGQQEQRATLDQFETAKSTARRYVDWVFHTFPEIPRADDDEDDFDDESRPWWKFW